MPMEDGAGSIPIMMGGAASQSALVGGRPPGPPPTAQEAATAMYPLRTAPATPPPARVNPDRIIDQFVHAYLAKDLMKMSPKDGWVAAPEHTWVLAGDADAPVLIYSLSGADITLTSALPAKSYKAMWFDPRSGIAQDANSPSTAAQTVLAKPDAQDWLLLLTPQDR